MKKLKTAGLALALVLGVSGAFFSHSASASSKSAASYNWNVYDRSGHLTGTLSNETEAQAETSTGCGPGTVKCAQTTNATPVLTIYFQ